MRIYLTKYETMSTEETQVISDAVFPQRVHWFPETYEKTKTGVFQVPKRVVDRLITPSIIEHVCKNKAPGKVGFILAGGSQVWGTGGVPLYEKCLTNSLAYSYKVEVLNVTNIFGARVASQLSANDYVTTDASTCASSLKVMMDVRHLIRDYDFDRVYVLGIEDSICNTVLNFFGSAKANICLDDYEKGARPSAFDSSNGGFYLGQGGVLADRIGAEQRHAIRRGSRSPSKGGRDTRIFSREKKRAGAGPGQLAAPSGECPSGSRSHRQFQALALGEVVTYDRRVGSGVRASADRAHANGADLDMG
ncbi:MAG: hypothetical protein EBS60_03445 [Verrucomicrobia bacterium]|nr:hypothetical protein [Verrucomicrobiota bacterium]